jgi:hypothetical protein
VAIAGSFRVFIAVLRWNDPFPRATRRGSWRSSSTSMRFYICTRVVPVNPNSLASCSSSEFRHRTRGSTGANAVAGRSASAAAAARICSSVIMCLITFLLVVVGLDHGQNQTFGGTYSVRAAMISASQIATGLRNVSSAMFR